MVHGTSQLQRYDQYLAHVHIHITQAATFMNSGFFLVGTHKHHCTVFKWFFPGISENSQEFFLFCKETRKNFLRIPGIPWDFFFKILRISQDFLEQFRTGRHSQTKGSTAWVICMCACLPNCKLIVAFEEQKFL